MNLSFLFLLSPIFLLKIPLEIILCWIFLGFSSLLYHNPFIFEMFNHNLVYIFDQINIINTSTMISFGSFSLSLNFISMYMLEQFFYGSCYTCLFVYFINFLNVISSMNIILFLMNSFLYLNSQGRDFTYFERYLWHFLQGLYIFLTLKRNFPYRFHFCLNKSFHKISNIMGEKTNN